MQVRICHQRQQNSATSMATNCYRAHRTHHLTRANQSILDAIGFLAQKVLQGSEEMEVVNQSVRKKTLHYMVQKKEKFSPK